MIQKTYYRCDPEKNTKCKKTGCALTRGKGKKAGIYRCDATKDPECAMLNEEGRPIVAFVVMRGEDDGTD